MWRGCSYIPPSSPSPLPTAKLGMNNITHVYWWQLTCREIENPLQANNIAQETWRPGFKQSFLLLQKEMFHPFEQRHCTVGKARECIHPITRFLKNHTYKSKSMISMFYSQLDLRWIANRLNLCHLPVIMANILFHKIVNKSLEFYRANVLVYSLLLPGYEWHLCSVLGLLVYKSTFDSTKLTIPGRVALVP